MSTTTNRIVLVDETGRVYDRTGVSVELSEQDEGLTLKVFVKPTTESIEANARHLKRLAEALGEDVASGAYLEAVGATLNPKYQEYYDQRAAEKHLT